MLKLASKLMAKIYNKFWLALFAFSATLFASDCCQFCGFDRAAERQAYNWSMEERAEPKLGAFCSLCALFILFLFFLFWSGVLIRIYIHICTHTTIYTFILFGRRIPKHSSSLAAFMFVGLFIYANWYGFYVVASETSSFR